jgi:hypothetical protein
VSLHSFRDVTIKLTETDSGKPVAAVPFRVHYEYYPADSPIVYHLELRTPAEVQARTDENGEAVVKLADYAWTTLLEVHDKERGYFSLFILDKQSIRKGGVIADHYQSDNYPKLRLELQPIKGPNKTVETNRRPASPLSGMWQFGSASYAPPSLSAALAHLSRYMALENHRKGRR